MMYKKRSRLTPFTTIAIWLVCLDVTTTLALLNQIDKDEILNAHNTYRRLYANGAYSIHVADMNKLIWNTNLEERSKRLLRCENIRTLAGSEDVTVNIGFSSQDNASVVVRKWFGEIRHILPEFRACLHLADCKKFLTMMNSKHRHMGCSTQSCGVAGVRANVLLCLYSGGNDIFDPYKIGSPCTKCSGETSFCENGLCVDNCQRTNSDCDCRKTCSLTGVGHGRLNVSSCSCECSYGMGPNCDEPCQNPEQYLDFDICGTITAEHCNTDDDGERELLQEFCPEQCLCKKAPSGIL